MAVTVRTGGVNYDEFPDGQWVTIEDGHLLVKAEIEGLYVTLGAYPPGGWASARRSDS